MVDVQNKVMNRHRFDEDLYSIQESTRWVWKSCSELRESSTCPDNVMIQKIGWQCLGPLLHFRSIP